MSARKEPETGWVIEHAESKASSPLYLALGVVHVGGVPQQHWSPNHHKAMRFARQIDGVSYRTVHCFSAEHRVCEHEWG